MILTLDIASEIESVLLEAAHRQGKTPKHGGSLKSYTLWRRRRMTACAGIRNVIEYHSCTREGGYLAEGHTA